MNTCTTTNIFETLFKRLLVVLGVLLIAIAVMYVKPISFNTPYSAESVEENIGALNKTGIVFTSLNLP